MAGEMEFVHSFLNLCIKSCHFIRIRLKKIKLNYEYQKQKSMKEHLYDGILQIV